MHWDTSDIIVSSPPSGCMAENRIGYEFIDKGYFYVQGSNTSDVVRIGSYGDHSAIKLFINNSCDAAYNIGVINSADPTLYIARSDASTPTFYIRGSDGNIGIGTSAPQFTLDVWGTMRVANLISDSISLSNIGTGGTNTISTSNTILTNIIAISGSNGVIDVSNSDFSNVQNIIVNSNATVHDLVVQDTTYIGGDLELHGMYRHVMGKMQTVYASLGQVMYSTSNLTELGFIVSWANPPTAFELVEVTSDFYGVGCDTRFSLDYKKYINPSDNLPNFPGEDFSTALTQKKTDNVVLLQPHIHRHTSNSVRVGAQWQLQEAIEHSASMNVNIFAPISIGSVGLAGYQILSNVLTTYDMQTQTFLHPSITDANTMVFGTSTYIYGFVRYTHGKMQRVYASAFSDTNNAELGFIFNWSVSSPNEIVFVRGKSFSTRGASEFTKWIPYNDLNVTVFESLLGSTRVQITRPTDTAMIVSVLQDGSDAVVGTSLTLEVVASTRVGTILCSAYRTHASITRYLNPSTNTFVNTTITNIPTHDITGVVRNTLGYIQTMTASLGDVVYTTQLDNELGFVVSWSEVCYHNIFEAWGVFTANDDTNQTKVHYVFRTTIHIDDNTITADITPMVSKQTTASVLNITTNVTKYANTSNTAKISIQWSVDPSITQHRANLSMSLRMPEDLGTIAISGLRIANNVLTWYHDVANTFTASALAPLTNSTAPGSNTLIRQHIGGMQRILVTYGNLRFKESATHRLGFRVSWANSMSMVIYTSGSYLAHGQTTRVALDYSSVVHVPDVENSTTVYLTKVQSENIHAPVTCHVVGGTSTSFETYVQWTLANTEDHYGSLQMEFIAPIALGELQLTGFYVDAA